MIGAGLDVTDPEPINKNSPLLKKKNVVVLPHIGSATDKTRRDMAIQCLENIKAGLKGEDLPFSV
jgi:phosphoglycerate dehydrogenase-like enzyme